MSDEDEEDKAAGAPLWMATFADLMSLLMCFFVLILSFSELDVIKYKQIAEPMKDAFGVQQQMELTSVPKGTSVVATEFQPGIPQPTPFETIQQVTTILSGCWCSGREDGNVSYAGWVDRNARNRDDATTVGVWHYGAVERSGRLLKSMLPSPATVPIWNFNLEVRVPAT